MQNQKIMGFMSSGVFWGIIVILIGLSIILREVFHVHIPFFRIILAVLFIYWGLKMLVGSFGVSSGGNSAIFTESKMNYDGSQRDYNIIFGKGKVDLFKTEIPTEDKRIEVNVVFGDAEIILNDSVPTLVEMHAAFGSVRAPDKTSAGFGNTSFANSAYKEGSPCLKIKASAVFGNIEIRSKRW